MKSVLLAALVLAFAAGPALAGGIVSGYAIDPWGKPAANVRIVADSPAGIESVRTNNDGFFLIFNVVPGATKVFVENPGFVSIPTFVCVQEGVQVRIPLIAARQLKTSIAGVRAESFPNPFVSSDLYSVGPCSPG